MKSTKSANFVAASNITANQPAAAASVTTGSARDQVTVVASNGLNTTVSTPSAVNSTGARQPENLQLRHQLLPQQLGPRVAQQSPQLQLKVRGHQSCAARLVHRPPDNVQYHPIGVALLLPTLLSMHHPLLVWDFTPNLVHTMTMRRRISLSTDKIYSATCTYKMHIALNLSLSTPSK